MAVYSHSKINTFHQCKYKYKLQYIDKIVIPIPDTIETFMGKLVHTVLEKLYKYLSTGVLLTLEDLVKTYEGLWDAQWSDDIVIVKKNFTALHYKQLGARYVQDYYTSYHPFDQTQTLALETQDFLQLNAKHRYHIRIDRLSVDEENNYYVCDYKTNSSLKSQRELDEDTQLAMYALWVRQRYPNHKTVKLIWYFLAFDKELNSSRDNQELEVIRKDILDNIDIIESCTDYPTNVSKLCHWCKFKSICPAWTITPTTVKKEEVNIAPVVDKLADLEVKLKQVTQDIKQTKQELIDYASKNKLNTLTGTDKVCTLTPHEKLVLPEKKELLLALIKQHNLQESLSNINFMLLQKHYLAKELPQQILDILSSETAYRISLKKRDQT